MFVLRIGFQAVHVGSENLTDEPASHCDISGTPLVFPEEASYLAWRILRSHVSSIVPAADSQGVHSA